MTHCRLESCVSNSRRIVGTARLRIVLSSTGMATETIATDAANQRLGSSGSSIDVDLASPASTALGEPLDQRCGGHQLLELRSA